MILGRNVADRASTRSWEPLETLRSGVAVSRHHPTLLCSFDERDLAIRVLAQQHRSNILVDHALPVLELDFPIHDPGRGNLSECVTHRLWGDLALDGLKGSCHG